MPPKESDLSHHREQGSGNIQEGGAFRPQEQGPKKKFQHGSGGFDTPPEELSERDYYGPRDQGQGSQGPVSDGHQPHYEILHAPPQEHTQRGGVPRNQKQVSKRDRWPPHDENSRARTEEGRGSGHEEQSFIEDWFPHGSRGHIDPHQEHHHEELDAPDKKESWPKMRRFLGISKKTNQPQQKHKEPTTRVWPTRDAWDEEQRALAEAPISKPTTARERRRLGGAALDNNQRPPHEHAHPQEPHEHPQEPRSTRKRIGWPSFFKRKHHKEQHRLGTPPGHGNHSGRRNQPPETRGAPIILPSQEMRYSLQEHDQQAAGGKRPERHHPIEDTNLEYRQGPYSAVPPASDRHLSQRIHRPGPSHAVPQASDRHHPQRLIPM